MQRKRDRETEERRKSSVLAGEYRHTAHTHTHYSRWGSSPFSLSLSHSHPRVRWHCNRLVMRGFEPPSYTLYTPIYIYIYGIQQRAPLLIVCRGTTPSDVCLEHSYAKENRRRERLVRLCTARTLLSHVCIGRLCVCVYVPVYMGETERERETTENGR